MSFQLFDQGVSAHKINRFKEQRAKQEREQEALKAFAESEPVREMLRFIQPSRPVQKGPRI